MRSPQASRFVQNIIIIAIIGIFAAIVIPGMKQASQRAARNQAPPAAASPADYDGVGNTIELPEGSDGAAGSGAGSGLRVLEPLIPLAVILAIIATIVRAASRKPTSRA